MTDTKPELKPCPFCGGKPTFVSENAFEDGTVWQIYCSNDDCPVQPATTGSFFQDETLSDWNTRAETPPVAEATKPTTVGAPVADDAVEALAATLEHLGQRTYLGTKAHYVTVIIDELSKRGFTITRAAAQMTDAELEREADLITDSDPWSDTYGYISRRAAIELAKKYRG